MASTGKEIITMIDMLPEEEQRFVCELMKRLVLAWDPDFIRLTQKEADELEIAHGQIRNGEYFGDDEIDWDNLDKMDLD